MAARYRYARFEVDPQERRLLVDGRDVAVGARAFDLLLALVERPDRLLGKQELLDLVWPGLVVEEHNLAVQIANLRRLIGPQAIATIPGRGYRWTARRIDAPDGPAPPRRGPDPDAALLPLVGRDQDMSLLRALIERHPLVSVVGAGGIGKTHLVRHLLQARDGADSGDCFIDLSNVARDQAAHLPHGIAARLGVQIGPGDAATGLAQALAGRAALIVLDNTEQVVDEVARIVKTLVEANPELRLITTGQAPLGIAAERVFRLGALAWPAPPFTLEQAGAQGAVAFFVDRAQAADRRFTLNRANVDLVVDVCRRLDGLPLAIELAAVRLPVLGLQGIADGLEQRFRLLGGGRRLAPARQQTLRAALDWSHGLLAPDEAVTFRRLGVFVGAFDLELAQRVAADEALDRWAVLEALSALIERSLVVADGADVPRYRLLDSPRDYARERLQAAGEERAVLARHAAALRDRLWEADQDWQGGRLGVDALRRRVEPDLADARAACAWAARHDPATAVALAPCLDWALVNEPAALRGSHWESTAPLVGADVPPAVRARWWAGWCQWLSQRGDEQREAKAERALAETRALGDPRCLYSTLRFRIWIHALRTQADAPALAAAQACLEEMRALEDPAWPPALRAMRRRAEAEFACLQQDWALAIGHLQHAAELAEAGDDARGRLSAGVARLDAQLLMCRYDDAVRDGAPLVAALRQSRFESTRIHASHNLALALLHAGDHAGARAVIADAFDAALRFRLLDLFAGTLALMAAREQRHAEAAVVLGYLRRQIGARGELQQPNEARTLREVEQGVAAAIEAAELARLIRHGADLEGAGLQAALRRIVAT
ncbi:MAG: helix-turn-helix transcriptional regulator [Burkholderiales bacterium]|nr:helix-turn-helix transcriptional regulator [Burkholderiales bacterium]MDE1927171.1 helix-turn-helix transcriptional regulator [Burkholderiales bacterium]MDE2157812.1 helix-turn-helix transcriptional regulator [Burkholderiales bacterium]MDE2504384.1 helix-turn-helix transcriptional regulator [Burkholderiales bacterium]